MKMQYFADASTLYVNICETARSDSGGVGPDLLADYGGEGAIIDLTTEHTSVHADLGSVDVWNVPHVRLIERDRPERRAVGRQPQTKNVQMVLERGSHVRGISQIPFL